MTSNEHPKKLLSYKMRRLQLLKEMQAFFGPGTDPKIILEIEDLEAEIGDLTSVLGELEKLVYIYQLLLIGTLQKDPWLEVITEASKCLGVLKILGEKEAFKQILLQDYDLVILDSSEVNNVTRLISFIRAHRSKTGIIVVTASPTWKSARHAFRSGANDYIRKSMFEDDIFSVLLQVLDRQISTSWDLDGN